MKRRIAICTLFCFISALETHCILWRGTRALTLVYVRYHIRREAPLRFAAVSLLIELRNSTHVAFPLVNNSFSSSKAHMHSGVEKRQ